MGIRSSRLKALPHIKDRSLAFAIAFSTFMADTVAYFDESDENPEVIEPAEIG